MATQRRGSRAIVPAALALGALAVMPASAENIDPANDGSQYAYQENQGWLNAEPLGNGGPGIQVGATALTGYVWAENVGWINLSCANLGTCGAVSYGVTNAGGVLSGYAWGENVGWISFSCANRGTCGAVSYGVTIDAAGVFNGNAWGENVGWVTWSDTSPFAYKVQTCSTITLTPASLPGGNAGTAYSQTITASGGVAPYTFARTAGTLPPGLTLSSGGVLSGTPTTTGSYGFTVTATDSRACTGSRAYSVTIQPPTCSGVTITLAPSTLSDATASVAYGQTITASGGTAPYTFSVTAGTLPPGLSLATSGALTGTPTAKGTYPFTVTARDANGCTGTRAYTVVVRQIVDYLVGEGLGFPNRNGVKVFTQAGAATAVNFFAYGAGQYGTNVASGDVDGGTHGEILTGPGPGAVYGPQVRGWRRDASSMAKINFYAYGTLRYGVNVTSGNVDADVYDEMVTGPGPGAVFAPQVRGFNYDGASLVSISKINFNAYGAPLQYGVNVTLGNVDGDAFAEIVTGKGPRNDFSSQVRGFGYDGSAIAAIPGLDFNAFSLVGYGVNVAAGDLDRDGIAEIACTPGPGPTHPARVLGFNYDNVAIAAMAGFDRTPYTTLYGGRVGVGDLTRDLRQDLVTGAGRDVAADSTVKAFDYNGSSLAQLGGQFVAFAGDTYGVNVAAGELGY